MGKYSAVVLGGGISGLTTAYYLSRMGRKVALVESSNRLGGWVRTIRNPDGINYEVGPRSVRPVGSTANATCLLLEDLGLENEVTFVKKTEPAARVRMILLDKQLVELPANISSLFLPTTAFGKPLIATLMGELFKKRPDPALEDDSLYNFATRHFGSKIADNGIDPLIRGITAGDCREISVSSLMAPLFEGEKTHGSVVKAMLANSLSSSNTKIDRQSMEWSKIFATAQARKWAIYSLKPGLETITERLTDELRKRDCKIYSNSKANSIDFKMNGKAVVDLGFEKLEANHVFAAIPAYSLGPLIEKSKVPRGIASFLKSVPFVDVAVVNLEYRGQDVLNGRKAFGYLVPSHQRYCSVLGVSFDTCSFPQKDRVILTVMMGGKWFDELFGTNCNDPEIFFSTARREVQERLGITRSPERYFVSVLRKCIPQHVIGHKAKLLRCRKEIERSNLPLTLVGASYDGISINDCVHYAKAAALSTNLSS
ncbi:unnamed protein product [Notodromas monacha]|uniref:Protoporphyrinogen oxidase n=1 Tax=Notodromas monacha TaxID=399045 RepID=A0A7R9BT26_9CRUS|nr:unnamed protein product [Notodromas monacha]CAG0920158.1 unnamed protein product [Notodromas monacha]